MSLRALGWCPFFEQGFAPFANQGLVAARVAVQHRGGYEVWTEDSVLAAEVSGRFRHQAPRASDYPAVGDWVAIEPIAGESRGIIQALIPRRTKFSRTAAGVTTEEQVLASNVDEIFILESLAARPNLRRIERFLTLAWESGATPVVILTKCDLCDDVPAALDVATDLAKGGAVLAISCTTARGIGAIRKRIRKGRTIALLGPSGAGKSTLINYLAGDEIQPVLPVREVDQKGRHTTTSREMVFLSGGGVLIDTPGLRELQLWEGAEGVEVAFADIEAIAPRCRFTDCQHKNEPGCAVRLEVEQGRMDSLRVAAFQKLRSEIAEFAKRRDQRVRDDEHRRGKGVTRSLRGQKFEED